MPNLLLYGRLQPLRHHHQHLNSPALSPVELVNTCVNIAAAEDNLTWDETKESRREFNVNSKAKLKTLGLTIRADFSFQRHIKDRTRKAQRVADILVRLANSNGGV